MRILAAEAGFSHQLGRTSASSGELTAVTAQDSGGRLVDIVIQVRPDDEATTGRADGTRLSHRAC